MSTKSFYFYDLETTGFSPRSARIMQFGGQRTDMQFKPIGQPHNYLIKITEDVLPEPDAVLVTGITPQKTLSEGITEAEFLKIFHSEIATPDTIFVGFNNVRFDDEFMRFLHYRNFYDPYEWQWRDNRSRFDLLDPVRMTRALRPKGIKWPFASDGSPSNQLGLLTSVNKLDHQDAHDALSDVMATISLARLIYSKQAKLFDYLLTLRDKRKVSSLVGSGKPFVYTSGKYPSEYEKTTVVSVITDNPKRQGVLVYDLRHDPAEYTKLSVAEIVEAWQRRYDDPGLRLPVKTLQYNRCPALAPLSVLDKDSQSRLSLDLDVVTANHKKLKADKKFADNLLKALEIMDKSMQARLLEDQIDVDERLYEGFFDREDQTKMSLIRATDGGELSNLDITFKDDRLRALLPLYKARNYPKYLTDEDRLVWERFRERKLMGGKNEGRLSRYFKRIAELEVRPDLSDRARYILEELKFYGQSVAPTDLE